MNAQSKVVALTVVVALLAVAGTIVFAQKTKARLTSELTAAQAEAAKSEARAKKAETELQATRAERDALKTQNAEVHRLRGEVSNLRKAAEAAQKVAAAPAPSPKQETNPPAPPPLTPEPVAEQAPPAQSAAEIARHVTDIRAKVLSNTASPEEIQWLSQVHARMKELEKSPAEFAQMQTAMIEASTGINDPQKLEQIRSIIERSVQSASTRGLDLNSASNWDVNQLQQREQLDNRATSAVQGLLTPEERAAFEQSIGGVMLQPDNFLGVNQPQGEVPLPPR